MNTKFKDLFHAGFRANGRPIEPDLSGNDSEVPSKNWPFSTQLLAQRCRGVVIYVGNWMGLTEEAAAKYMEQERHRLSLTPQN